MSSVIIYGDSAGVGKNRKITGETKPSPAGFYGDSKLKAEQALMELSYGIDHGINYGIKSDINPDNPDFKVALIRCPMVYGRGCKGNFRTLESLSGKLPVFPSIKNERSMIYVENLAEFIRLLTESGKGGIFYPQNDEYVSTCEMVVEIANAMGRNIIPCGILNPPVKLVSHMPGKLGRLVNKAFGSLTIDKDLSTESFQGYCRYSLHDSIRKIYENQYNNGSL
jgi:UDP-glucose 4-epimerase